MQIVTPLSKKALHHRVTSGGLNEMSLLRKGTALLVGRSRDRSPVLSLGIFSEANNGTMCPGVDSASKYEYQEISWE
jgi:hypothetical protein